MYNMYKNRMNCCCNNKMKNNVIEEKCTEVATIQEVLEMSEQDSCKCGFDVEEPNMFPENPMFAQSYVPIQYMNKTFTPEVGLKMGTIFPELVSPYMPGQSMREIMYIEEKNQIGEGCNNAR